MLQDTSCRSAEIGRPLWTLSWVDCKEKHLCLQSLPHRFAQAFHSGPPKQQKVKQWSLEFGFKIVFVSPYWKLWRGIWILHTGGVFKLLYCGKFYCYPTVLDMTDMYSWSVQFLLPIPTSQSRGWWFNPPVSTEHSKGQLGEPVLSTGQVIKHIPETLIPKVSIYLLLLFSDLFRGPFKNGRTFPPKPRLLPWNTLNIIYYRHILSSHVALQEECEELVTHCNISIKWCSFSCLFPLLNSSDIFCEL